MLSVLILTKNEEQDLPDCLKSVYWCDDIHVFDSFSDDKTVEIAENFGAKVTRRKFDNYAAQRNAALENVPFINDWIFILDADERIPESLWIEMQQKLLNVSNEVNGFRIQRRDFLNI